MDNDTLGASEETETSDEELKKTPELSSVESALELSKKLLDFSD